MVEEDPTLWKIEDLAEDISYLLFRSVHEHYWRYWDNPTKEIEQNFISLKEETEDYELSLDWSKYCIDPKLTLNRRFLFWSAHRYNSCVDIIIEQYGLKPSKSIPRNYLCVEDLDSNSDIVTEARKTFGVFRFQIDELLDLINSSNLPLKLYHKPIKKVDKDNKFLNHAHSIIKGLTGTNYTRIRTLLSDIANWCKGLEPIP